MKFKSLFQRRSSGDGTSSRKKNQESPYASPVAQDDEPVPDEENGLKNEKPTFCKNCRYGCDTLYKCVILLFLAKDACGTLSCVFMI